MTDPDKVETDMTDALLREVAAQTPLPDDALMARVLADAARIQMAPVVAAPGRFAQLREMMGGWPGMGGLALAGIAGLWVGVAPPAGVETLAADILGTTEAISFVDDADWLFAEGALDG